MKPSRPIAKNTWLEWAAFHRERLLRTARARGRPRMRLLRLDAARYSWSQHRWLSVCGFHLHIHLAIRPGVLETTRALIVSHAAAREFARALHRPPAPPTLVRAMLSSRPPASVLRPPARIEWPRGTMSAAADRLAPAALGGMVDQARYHATTRHEVDESAGETVARRLHRQTRRVEERTTLSTTLVVRRQVISAPASAAAEALDDRFDPQTGPRWDTIHEAPWVKAAAAPALSIGALTDRVIREIDSRMIASRERMGRV